MKKITIFGLMIAMLLIAGANAQAVTIMDNYYGNFDNGNGAPNRDIIGAANLFETTKMDVSSVGGNLNVTIYSDYFDNVGYGNTELGDLFISTNGWQVMGSAPYVNDDYTNGGWEYALVLDNHKGSTSGILNLYSANDKTKIQLSNYYDALYQFGANGVNYRSEQEVRFDPTGGNSLAQGNWLISGLTLTFAIPNTFYPNFNDLAFHWTQTCANDVIEGKVPEPSTLLLLGSGLLGLALYGRKRFKR